MTSQQGEPATILTLASLLDRDNKAKTTTTTAQQKQQQANTASNGSTAQQASNEALGGCRWIPWNNGFIQSIFFDPTRWFSFLVLGIIHYNYLKANNWDFELMLSGFLLNPVVVASFLTSALVVVWSMFQSSGSRPTLLPVYDRWAAEWYLWNACLFHVIMDGASGTFRLVPVVVQQYDTLDLRFPTGHVVPYTVGWIEIFIMAPLCWWTVAAILTKSTSRFPLEILTSTFQLFGMLVFVGSELYEEQVNVPALKPVGVKGNAWQNVDFFNEYQFIYYWFGFWFCNLVWGYIPALRIYRAWLEIQRSLEHYNNTVEESKRK